MVSVALGYKYLYVCCAHNLCRKAMRRSLTEQMFCSKLRDIVPRTKQLSFSLYTNAFSFTFSREPPID